jgi:hypothetical protein
MIHVEAAPGKRILDPFDGNSELKPGIRPDDAYWRRRAAEGGVIITAPVPHPAQ